MTDDIRKMIERFQVLLAHWGYKSTYSQQGEGLRLSLKGGGRKGEVFFSSENPWRLQLEGFSEKDRLLIEGIHQLLTGYHIYVDGSSMQGQVGYGFLVIKDGELVKEEGGSVTGRISTASHQVGGELWAVQRALTWCQKQGVRAVTIYCDLEAIIYWATGVYQARIPLTQNFKAFLDSCGIEITWRKVEAHSGEPFNERVDVLAKEGAGVGEESVAVDDLSLLEEVSREFSSYLQERGFQVEERGIFNQQCAKLLLHKGEEKLGHFNVYRTKKDPCLPRYHELKEEEVQRQIADLWKEFRRRKER